MPRQPTGTGRGSTAGQRRADASPLPMLLIGSLLALVTVAFIFVAARGLASGPRPFPTQAPPTPGLAVPSTLPAEPTGGLVDTFVTATALPSSPTPEAPTFVPTTPAATPPPAQPTLAPQPRPTTPPAPPPTLTPEPLPTLTPEPPTVAPSETPTPEPPTLTLTPTPEPTPPEQTPILDNTPIFVTPIVPTP